MDAGLSQNFPVSGSCCFGFFSHYVVKIPGFLRKTETNSLAGVRGMGYRMLMESFIIPISKAAFIDQFSAQIEALKEEDFFSLLKKNGTVSGTGLTQKFKVKVGVDKENNLTFSLKSGFFSGDAFQFFLSKLSPSERKKINRALFRVLEERTESGEGETTFKQENRVQFAIETRGGGFDKINVEGAGKKAILSMKKKLLGVLEGRESRWQGKISLGSVFVELKDNNFRLVLNAKQGLDLLKNSLSKLSVKEAGAVDIKLTEAITSMEIEKR